jgi:hypothetical protein
MKMKLFARKYSLALFLLSIIIIELTSLTKSSPINMEILNEIDSIDVDQVKKFLNLNLNLIEVVKIQNGCVP